MSVKWFADFSVGAEDDDASFSRAVHRPTEVNGELHRSGSPKRMRVAANPTTAGLFTYFTPPNHAHYQQRCQGWIYSVRQTCTTAQDTELKASAIASFGHNGHGNL
uniref:Uncharacterized protein n=1 Tax=Schistocephalus solidus TaxID=70667 RepID=A0A0X3PYV2_SCHSO